MKRLNLITKIFIACDHAAFQFKQELFTYIQKKY